jgi:hypothetical protein
MESVLTVPLFCLRVTKADVSPLDDSLVIGFGLDQPSVGQAITDSPIQIRGWVINSIRTGVTIDAYNSRGGLLRSARAIDIRYDVWDKFGRLHDADVHSGFSLTVSPVDLVEHDYIDLYARITDVRATHLVRISVDIVFRLVPAEGPTLGSIFVRTVGRTGSTALMRILDCFPDIVVEPENDFELFYAQYELARFRLETLGIDHQNWGGEYNMFRHQSALGANPFLCGRFSGLSEFILREAFASRTLVRDRIRRMYELIADRQRKRPVAFAEKVFEGHIGSIASWVLDDVKTIILVRDPRAIYVSRLRFAEQTGRVGPTFDALFFMQLEILAREYEIGLANNQNVCVVRQEDLAHNAGVLELLEKSLSFTANRIHVTNLLAEFSNDVRASTSVWRSVITEQQERHVINNARLFMGTFAYDDKPSQA